MDVLSKSQRSELMGRVKSTGTKPEEALRRALLDVGLRPRKQSKGVEGRPDVLFRKAKLAVFVDGCFWHGCPTHGRLPENGAEYWSEKLIGNKVRDHTVASLLMGQGYMVIRFWEHDLKNPQGAAECAKRVAQALLARLG